MIAQHLSTSNERYTPEYIIEPIRAALGGAIDLDPASSVIANQTIKARKYFSLADSHDGLLEPWYSRTLFLNPPYGKHHLLGVSNQLLWTKTLITKYHAKQFEHAVLLVNAAMGDSFFRLIWDHAALVCFPFRRIRFNDEFGQALPAPPNANAIAYFSRNSEDRFIEHMSKIGACVRLALCEK